jgi:hypothetical protein
VGVESTDEEDEITEKRWLAKLDVPEWRIHEERGEFGAAGVGEPEVSAKEKGFGNEPDSR